eukprot:TRINITY_DN133_c0_g1_i1.p1 TRINITY_DN133_c0_g1~~TRINITY_DN133_c0_g1_i1.p1  ORF type:complete len:288 (+),score=44.88 TRINITY_DN133_c0_g1_i1:184-1047(+)
MKTASQVLKETSRLFYVSIMELPPGLKEITMAAYLCNRGVDEIEDHPNLPKAVKIGLLHNVSHAYRAGTDSVKPIEFTFKGKDYSKVLPEATTRISEWAMLPSKDFAPSVWEISDAVTLRMAYWVSRNWKIRSEADLDVYTYDVIGCYGNLHADAFSFYENIKLDRRQLIQILRGLSSVNMIKDQNEDAERGVSLFPEGWTRNDMRDYAYSKLLNGKLYLNSIPRHSGWLFYETQVRLGLHTLDALFNGKPKLTREEVTSILSNISAEYKAAASKPQAEPCFISMSQ